MNNLNFNFCQMNSGFGALSGGQSPMGGFPSLGGGMPQMSGMGSSTLGGGGQMMMMSMMSQMMMMVMQTMMSQFGGGQMPMSMGPGQFGGSGGGAQGSPLNGFLGGNSSGGNSRGGADRTSKADGPETRMDSKGKVGKINVGKLINAIPSGYRANARKHWPSIVAEAQKQGVKNKGALAYILATTVHESGAGRHMEEIASGSAYEGRSDLGNRQSGDGKRFKGRGYVQITGRNNYTKWGKKLGLNLVGNPELAEKPGVAAKILVGGMKSGGFTGKGLDDYFGKGKSDFVGARAIVNGSDKAGTFASTARAILNAMD